MLQTTAAKPSYNKKIATPDSKVFAAILILSLINLGPFPVLVISTVHAVKLLVGISSRADHARLAA
jgi:hypothetical protein